MAKLLSSCLSDKKVPDNYIFPANKRPGIHAIPARKATIPIVDLHDDDTNTIQHILKASQDYGLFQVINHEVPEELMREAMHVFEEYFKLSIEEKSNAINIAGEENNVCKLYTSSYNYDSEETHYWRDALRQSCSPLEQCMKYWPQKPTKYREIVGAYATAVKKLGSIMLELISQGLGLNRDYFDGPLSEDDFLIVNHYPPCPDPKLTLGLAKHSDPNLVTVHLPGDVPGLQLLQDGEWLGVDTLPNAFLVFIGNQLEIVSNGKLKSGVHRVVTNNREARTSAAFFINPSLECIVQPAKHAIGAAEYSPPIYKPFRYKDFFKSYTGPFSGDPQGILQAFKIDYN